MQLRGGDVIGFLDRIPGASQVIERNLEIRVVGRPLVDLPVDLEKGHPDGFGFSHAFANGGFQRTTFNRAIDDDELAELRLGIEATDFVSKPVVKLPACQGQRRLIQLHPTLHSTAGSTDEGL
ncbi:hypothetical protein A5655_24945 [Mycobacterium sp. 1081908.1]|nr:hypothetical protein A5655_24945 [Mycobacterium sp. 1081908.1]